MKILIKNQDYQKASWSSLTLVLKDVKNDFNKKVAFYNKGQYSLPHYSKVRDELIFEE